MTTTAITSRFSATCGLTLQAHGLPRYVVVSAWAVPVMVAGQFAFLAIVPVGLVLSGVLRNSRRPALRWSAGALAATFATPLVLWAVREDRAPSLSKDMDPVFAAAIVAASLAVLVTMRVRRR